MRNAIRLLASLKLTVVLLVLLCFALAAGTILESMKGVEAARAVYYAGWFKALLGAFAVNTLCALVDRGIFNRWRIGFAMTHLSMVVILGGAMVTDTFKTEGQLALWEGEQSKVFLERTDTAEIRHELPYQVKLDAFEIDRYPGTMRPAMFRSRVTILEKSGKTFPAVIEMNKELTHDGWSLFQSSYQIDGGREMTVLSVAKDPGQTIVFIGYTLLVLGMCVVLGTRIVQRRMIVAAQAAVRPTGRGAAASAAALLAAITILGLPTAARAAQVPDAATVETLRAMAVQHDGRSMPLDTLAREATIKITGYTDTYGMDPVAMVLGWSIDPGGWAQERIITVTKAVAGHVGVPATGYASFQTLVQNQPLIALFGQAHELAQAEQPLSALHKEAQALEDRLVRFQEFLNRQAFLTVPSVDPVGRWSAPQKFESGADLLANLQQVRAGKLPAHYPGTEAIQREITYNQMRPSRLSWLILVPATLLSLLTWRRPRRWLDALSVTGLVAGFAVMTWGIALRWQIADRIPASNMYESLLFLGWGVGAFALLASIFMRNRLVIFNAAAMSAATMLLVDLLPIDAFIHPMPPVLSGTPWLAIHVPIIMVSYSVLALGVLVAHMQIGLGIFPKRQEAAAHMNDLLYWYMLIGSILLIAGILTGSIWAASSWGRYWGWDPKEVWSLIAFLAYMAILHGRFERWIGPFGVAVASIAAFWTILMTYIGVNYVLSAGLHSYGFGGSDVVFWMLAVLAAEVAFIAGAWLVRSSRAQGAVA